MMPGCPPLPSCLRCAATALGPDPAKAAVTGVIPITGGTAITRWMRRRIATLLTSGVRPGAEA